MFNGAHIYDSLNFERNDKLFIDEFGFKIHLFCVSFCHK